jgi:hypothetical protein
MVKGIQCMGIFKEEKKGRRKEGERRKERKGRKGKEEECERNGETEQSLNQNQVV